MDEAGNYWNHNYIIIFNCIAEALFYVNCYKSFQYQNYTSIFFSSEYYSRSGRPSSEYNIAVSKTPHLDGPSYTWIGMTRDKHIIQSHIIIVIIWITILYLLASSYIRQCTNHLKNVYFCHFFFIINQWSAVSSMINRFRCAILTLSLTYSTKWFFYTFLIFHLSQFSRGIYVRTRNEGMGYTVYRDDIIIIMIERVSWGIIYGV